MVTVMSCLYDLIIQPLIMIYDVLFSLSYNMLENTVASIFALSIMINFLVLPLYRKADLMQKEQHEKVMRMKPWVDRIRSHFHGDERMMILSAYYRIEKYNPLSTIKEAGPLLLQVPFFIAAYRYISSLTLLNRSSFGPIENLLDPDGLLSIAGISINILPIIMTLINCASGYVYSQDLLLRQKIQMYGLSLVFLILLYNSPSGLVLYWIMNNIFSLLKNLYYQKLYKYKDYISVILSFLLIVFIVCEMALLNVDRKVDMLVSEVILICVIINLIVTALRIKQTEAIKAVSFFDNILTLMSKYDMKTQIALVIFPELCLAMLLGFYIPSSVIASSPLDFINRSTGAFQSDLLIYTATVYAGLLLIWTTVLILAREGKKRQIIILVLWAFLGVALYNQFFAPVDTDSLYTDMTFDAALEFSGVSVMFNLLLGFFASLVMIFIVIKCKRFFRIIASVISVSLLLLFSVNVLKIDKEIRRSASLISVDDAAECPIMLSRTGRNVVVIMLDRAIGTYVPFIFNEMPDLNDSFDGFVYYPNTVSYGVKTNYGSPGLFGGYEYTPYEMDKRGDELLKDKHNEALMMMPVLFMNEGYQVTVCDPPYANYQDIPDLSIYDDYPEIRTYNLSGRYTDKLSYGMLGKVEERQKHNVFFYSLFRSVPYYIRDVVYDNGRYFSVGMGSGSDYTKSFLDAYSVLWNMCDITSIYDDDQGSFLMFQNETPHNPTRLNPPGFTVDGSSVDPDYEYSDMICDGRTMFIDNDRQWGHYCINVATYQAVAEWLDFLKEEGVYDNTRIILVADHGYYLGQFPDLIHPSGLDVESFNPLLMVKDFDSHGGLVTDETFMTNADVPTLAVTGVIDDPVNPFTGLPIDDHIKHDGPVIVTDSYNWVVSENNGTTFDLAGGQWWLVHDDMRDMNNWTVMDAPDAA